MSLDSFKAEYEAALAQQGVKVEWNEDGVPGGVPSVGGYNNPDNWVATLTRDGVRVDTLVTLGRIATTGMSPEQLAQQDIWNLRYTGAVQSPQGQLPSDWYATPDDDLRRFYEVNPHLRPRTVPAIPPPGPTPTLPVGGATIQPHQAPPNPNGGTVLTNPGPTDARTDSARLTFWQWNYYYQEKTGRIGPDPGEVGVASGTTLMSGAEWVRAVGNWYGGPVTVPPVSSGTAGGVGGTPTTPPIAVGGTGTTTNPTPPVGGTNPPPATPGPDLDRKSFWTWNALMEQTMGWVGPDPAMYGIHGADLMTKAEWEALTNAYYEAKKAEGKNGAKPADNTMLYLAAAAAAFLILRKG